MFNTTAVIASEVSRLKHVIEGKERDGLMMRKM
jgi:hypothetical protein